MHVPERRVGRIHDQPAQPIFGVVGGGGRANEALTAIGDFRLDLHQIERRRLADPHAHAVLRGQLLRELQ